MRIVEVESLVQVEYPTRRSMRRDPTGLDPTELVEGAEKIVTVTVKLECTMDEWNAFLHSSSTNWRLLG